MSSVFTKTDTNPQDVKEQLKPQQLKVKIIWIQIFYFVFFHTISFYGIYLCFTSTSWKTMFFAFVFARIMLSVGLSAGLHRLWSHRSYKAKLPLRIFICICTFALGQDNIFQWCRDHRVHHKYADTDADPYNIKRGFFFSHIGWLIVKKHPDVYAGGKKLPMDDLLADPVVRFNKKYYWPMFILFSLIVPVIIPVYFWEEKWLDAFCVAGMLRYLFQLHCTFTINSIGHTFGYRPFDKTMEATESIVVESLQPGEGSHNYHHVFPRDYTTKDQVLSLNLCRIFIEFMAFIGQAYDLKMSSDKLVQARRLKTGDGR